MHEEENRLIFFCYCEGREREMGGWLECRLLLRDTAVSVRGKKALRDHGSEGRRQGKRKGTK